MTEETRKFFSDLSVEWADREDKLTEIADLILKEEESDRAKLDEINEYKRRYTERFINSGNGSSSDLPDSSAEIEEADKEAEPQTIDEIFAKAETEEY